MGVVSYEFETTSPISAARLFKAITFEADKLFPKAAPHAVKSVELQGNGGPGTLVKINFAEGVPFQYVKHHIDAVDKANLTYSYSVIEGGPLGDKLEKISFDNKLAAAGEGTLVKSSMKFFTIGDSTFTEDEIKEQIQRMDGVYKAVEAYLLANPDVCN
ncbi:Major pollen allergen Aln g 1 [Hibiscus syriacus]|uniref:Major pollen allergen Aln g 1 n=1 Tax=Hibiscus syriacus TaxID=106335 RepID=A0A6A3AVM6_HIBSY|nr:major pollen allergen Aln g 1-like isoform X1 [Hibiscus syriacus]XP_038995118.1 major pollen allergen Aln g 1-like isoform X2 [Hibiscus syriacus]KAE8708810.1 Major pollen allergen Aln g 1 [Hibiscus syriacus]